jgi:ankyrin repeat protein
MKTLSLDSQAVELDVDLVNLARAAFQHARAGETERMAQLLRAGLPVNLCNERGDSLLMLASYHGNLNVTRLLLEQRADPERANDRGQTPLAGAAFKGDAVVARLLLDFGARVDGKSAEGKTALMFAAMFDQLDVLKLLLERGADPELRDTRGCTALDYARAMGASGTANWLDQFPQVRRQPAA